MYHYGEVSTPGQVDAEKHENQGVQLIQEPMLRRRAHTADRWEDVFQEKGFIESRRKKSIRKTDVLSETYSFVCSEKGYIVVPCCGLGKQRIIDLISFLIRMRLMQVNGAEKYKKAIANWKACFSMFPCCSLYWQHLQRTGVHLHRLYLKSLYRYGLLNLD